MSFGPALGVHELCKVPKRTALNVYLFRLMQVLGDKSMQIKYLNPNVLFVAAGVPDGSPLLPGSPPPQLRIELLDTVSRPRALQLHTQGDTTLSPVASRGPETVSSERCPGAFRHRLRMACMTLFAMAIMQGARGPVHAVLCENWAVYHYWSTANQTLRGMWLTYVAPAPTCSGVVAAVHGCVNHVTKTGAPFLAAGGSGGAV